MKKNRIIYIFLLIAAVIFAGAYESKLTFIILVTLITLPLLTLFMLVLERFALKLEVKPESLFVQKLRRFSITVTIRNRFIVPMSPVRVTGIFQDEDGNLIYDKTLIVSVMPFCKTELLFGGCLKYRGEYHLGACEAALYDLLGLFCIKMTMAQHGHISDNDRVCTEILLHLLDHKRILLRGELPVNITERFALGVFANRGERIALKK